MDKIIRPEDIEKKSMSIIRSELEMLGMPPFGEEEPVVLRVIHTTADFDYAENLRFMCGAVRAGSEALKNGCTVITDTNMARAGINKKTLSQFGGNAECFMADPEIAERAKAEGTTRAVASVKKAAELYPDGIYAVGNAPTALYELADRIREGLKPSLIIAVPVGFVNVVEAKEEILSLCCEKGIPVIAAMGRKGGSNVAASIVNALLYIAAGKVDPETRKL